jgi:hypothetical protein
LGGWGWVDRRGFRGAAPELLLWGDLIASRLPSVKKPRPRARGMAVAKASIIPSACRCQTREHGPQEPSVCKYFRVNFRQCRVRRRKTNFDNHFCALSFCQKTSQPRKRLKFQLFFRSDPFCKSLSDCFSGLLNSAPWHGRCSCEPREFFIEF